MLHLKQEYFNELKNIFEKYCPNAQIWAYGSRIRGDFHSGSDLDLVVKSFNDDSKNLFELKQLLNDSGIPFFVDVQEFDKLPKNFQDEIEKDYLRIY